MKSLGIFLYEWKHFIRSPFKLVALLLFVLAAIYGLHNGAGLYQEQMAEIEKVRVDIEEQRQKYGAYFEEGKKGPDNRPWIDLTAPFWSIWYSGIHHLKMPSPALVYSIGQAEQYGYYKQITFWASPYDADMTKEIANPERLNSGTLDFTFSLLYLLPLLLLILLYNLKSAESEQGFLSLIEVQATSSSIWLLSRVAFYVVLLFAVVLGLLSYGASLTNVFAAESTVFGEILLYSLLYLLFWTVIYYLVLHSGTSIIGNTLKMVGIWLLFAFIVPAAVLQWISIKKPANLMTDFIDATRDESWGIYDLPDSVVQEKLHALFPEIANSSAAQDSTKMAYARGRSTSALVNEILKESVATIEADNKIKNDLVRSTFLINPVAFFQNRFNSISQTHYNNYQHYRAEIQHLIDKQIRIMVLDTWNEVVVNKPKFLEYHNLLQAD